MYYKKRYKIYKKIGLGVDEIMYSTYIFDLYGTLVDINTDEKSRNLWRKLSLFYSFNGAYYKSSELKNAYIEKVKEYLNEICDTKYPDFPIENVFKDLYSHKGIEADEELIKSTAQIFRSLSMKYLRLYDGVIELLENLKIKNKKIYLLSNAQRIFTLYEMRILGIDKYFDNIYFSSDYKMCKPDKNFFQRLISDNNLDVSKSIMIGNDPVCDINGAEQLGMDTLYIKSNLSPEKYYNCRPSYKILDGDVKKIGYMIIK